MDKSELALKNEAELASAISEANNILKKNYQFGLSSYPVIDPQKEILDWNVATHTRLFKLESIAYDKNEDNLTKLSNVYNALAAVNGSVIIIIDSDGDKIDFYIGTKTENEQNVQIAFSALSKTLSGNFPGCVLKNQTKKKLEKIISKLFAFRDENSIEDNRTISSVNGISSIRKSFADENKTYFTQGIEKMIDSMKGEIYSAVIIADSVDQSKIELIKKGYEQLYTKLSPFASAELSLNYSEGSVITDTITNGISKSVSDSLSLSQSHSHTSTTSTSKSTSGGVSLIASLNKSKSTTKTESDTYTEGKTETKGTSNTDSYSKGISNALSASTAKGLQISTEDKTVKCLLEKIDVQLNRLSECGDLGMWNCSAYFIADDLQTSKTVASAYQALIRGENSGTEAIAINTWSYKDQDETNNTNYNNLQQYLRKLIHPEIYIGDTLPLVNPTSLISSNELTIQAGLPQKSVAGLAVAEFTPFGREVLLNGEKIGSVIRLGNIYHMGNKETSQVYIDKQSLASHTFITGSTGSGKSNAVYQLLAEAMQKKVNFLVIEPAKGEYKHIFGNRDDVFVFGTNPSKTKMLKINPFKFESDIHVLEHIDRLVEIFNVCWPMYAAMPAILKDAVECSYEGAGWNLEQSTNKYDYPLYPTFSDVLIELQKVIEKSEYSSDVKSNYAGSLITRINSLTNGINGQIFVTNEIGDEILFDKNVIVDLSRVASIETKALIMGVLVMRLQEYRISCGGMNKDLSHLTVLEEAHNLLKRTSTEQVTEGANLLGKSVEMLSQSIAEMRTYGEGFIISDQSPNMLDMSVIRNTNTKIILRLPDISDRELCGRAASLTDEQIIEVAKLPTGVAAVYQNNWIEPVLCKIEKYDENNEEYQYKPAKKSGKEFNFKKALIKILLCEEAGERVEFFPEDTKRMIIESNLDVYKKNEILKVIFKENKSISDVKYAIACLFDNANIFANGNNVKDIHEWNKLLKENIDFDFTLVNSTYQNLILQCILSVRSEMDNSLNLVYGKWCEFMKGEK